MSRGTVSRVFFKYFLSLRPMTKSPYDPEYSLESLVYKTIRHERDGFVNLPQNTSHERLSAFSRWEKIFKMHGLDLPWVASRSPA